MTNVASDVARGAQLFDLDLQCLALDREVVQDGLARVVGLLDDRATLLARALDERFAVHLRRLDESLGGQARVVVDLSGRALGLGDQRRGALLGLDEVRGAALLALGEDLGASFLGLGGHATGLFVGRTQDRRALGAEGAGQGRLVEGRVRGAALGLAQLVLEFADAGLEVAHLARDRLQAGCGPRWGRSRLFAAVVKFIRAISADDWRVVERIRRSSIPSRLRRRDLSKMA